MAVKRRIIWMTDEEWGLLKNTAKDKGQTVSQVIRDIWTFAANPPPAGQYYLGKPGGTTATQLTKAEYRQVPIEDVIDTGIYVPNTDVIDRAGRVMTQRERDALLRKINGSK